MQKKYAFYPSHFALQALFISLLPMIVWAQSESDLKREIKKLQEDIKRETELSTKESEASKNYLQNYKFRLGQLDQQLALSKKQNDSLAFHLAQLSADRETQKKSTDTWKTKKDQFSQFLATQIDVVIASVQKDFPIESEKRLEALKTLKSQLLSGQTPPEEGMDRLWSLLIDSYKSSLVNETYEGILKINENNDFTGTYIRYGTLFLGFLSKDESKAYILKADPKAQWIWSELTQSQDKQALIKAVQVAQGKAPAQMILLPFDRARIKNPDNKTQSSKAGGQ